MQGREHSPDQATDQSAGKLTRALGYLATVVWWFIFAILVVFALYVGLGRQLTSHIDRYSDDISAMLSDRTGLAVQVGQLSSRWHWLDPAVTVTDLTLRHPDTGAAIAELEHLRLRLDFLSSLARFRLVFEDFEADGLSLTLTRRAGLDVLDPPDELSDLTHPGGQDLQSWVKLAGRWLSDPRVMMTRISLAIDNGSGNLREMDIPRLDLIYRRGLFQASGRAMQPGTSTQLASFALVGQHFFRGEFTGQLYLDVDSGRLFDGLIDDLNWRGVRVEGFDLGGRAWLTFRHGEIEQIQGSVHTPYLQLGVDQQSLAPLEDIQARFGWRKDAPLQLQQLRWQWVGDRVEPFGLRIEPGADGHVLIADGLPLAPIRRLVQAIPLLPEVGNRALTQYRPAGYLDDVILTLPEDTASFELSARLRDVSVQAAQGAPSASGLHGTILMSADRGYVTLDTVQPSNLGFPGLFLTDWVLNTITGTVAWELAGPITRVFSDDLTFAYGEQTLLTGAFDLRLDKFGEDNLGLSVGVENGNASMLTDFIPAKVVDEGLYDWLTSAIAEAEITSGRYYGHGRIDSGAPRGSFVSSMWYEFDQARIRYDELWPELEAARGRVDIHNADTLVTLEEGRIGGLDLSKGEVRVVPGDGDAATRIKVDAEAPVRGSAVPFWMNNTPLGEMAGSATGGLEFDGLFELALNLDIPLQSDAQTEVQANVSTSNGAVDYPAAGLSWTGIEGNLAYHSTEGFSGEPLAARFLGHPISVEFEQTMLGDEAGGRALSVRQAGRLAMPGFLRELGSGEDLALAMAGTIDYSAELEVTPAATPRILVSSNLRGLALDWPEPLGKPAEQTAELSARIDPGVSDGIRISGDWQDRLGFDLLWRRSGFDLEFSYLNLAGHSLEDIRINALNLGDRWVFNTESERVQGRLMVPEEGVIDVDLQRLSLSRSEPDSDSDNASELLTLEEQLEAFRALKIGSWPDIDVKLDELMLGDQSAGRWQFRLRPQPFRLNVQDIEGQLQTLMLKGDMTWSVVDDRETSRFVGALTGGGLRELEALTGAPIPLNNEQTHVNLDLDWPGRPDEIALSELSGQVSVRLDDGVIMEQSGSAQLFRIFNLLNTDTLWRRLRLDFSDLYERGVAFDAISGKAVILNGLVTLDPELQLVGPSGAFKLNGTTNMADESLDMRLVLVLPVTQNLPLAAILMGASAPIGGALFVLDKILGDPLSKLTSATYSVTGSWSDPKVDLRRVFDTGE
ncbi:MAG: putative membrane protein [Marinobacter excellens HL-55]|uniref:Putative membrane protein n=1 Tax=Marinobacter excellens HL-55 TaxID=1305731 RepID=A0A0P7ZFH3_9GAMM|nr:MAG: putative membrane protein [Marinobacter excellens HL-55]